MESRFFLQRKMASLQKIYRRYGLVDGFLFLFKIFLLLQVINNQSQRGQEGVAMAKVPLSHDHKPPYAYRNYISDHMGPCLKLLDAQPAVVRAQTRAVCLKMQTCVPRHPSMQVLVHHETINQGADS